MHLVGFIIRIYHDARSSECQIPVRPLRMKVAICSKRSSYITEARSAKSQKKWEVPAVPRKPKISMKQTAYHNLFPTNRSTIIANENLYFVVCFLLGNFPASEFYMPTFRNTLFHGSECSETSAYKIQKPENYTEESIQHSENGKSFKSKQLYIIQTHE